MRRIWFVCRWAAGWECDDSGDPVSDVQVVSLDAFVDGAAPDAGTEMRVPDGVADCTGRHGGRQRG